MQMKPTLLTPKAIIQKLIALYDRADHLQAYLNDEAFSITIPFKRLSEKEIEQHFTAIRDWIESLRQTSLDIEFHTIAYRSLGEQSIPKRLHLNREQFLHHLGKQRAFEQHRLLIETTQKRFPQLLSLLREKPKLIMEYEGVWQELLQVCDYFMHHPKPHCYIRELDIEGVDTKFIEQYKSVLDTLLSRLLEPSIFDASMTKLAHHGFEKKYGLNYDLPTIRFRILDRNLYLHGLSDISLPLNEFQHLAIDCDTVFITENKINGLSFPDVERAIVIFGLGYGVESLKNIEWLQHKQLYYWGDIDTHGFAMLSQIRGYFPHLHSFLMDRKTLETYQMLAVQEVENKRFIGSLPHLTTEEQEVFEALKANQYGCCFRLEQERIPMGYWVERLS